MAESDRLRWRCRRGMLELDELLIPFFDRRYGELDDAERVAFERLLEYPDQVLLEVLMERMSPSDPSIAHVVKEIRRAVIPAT
ncbi:MAG: succinate dehydrogenase assembly factor 2 [Acidihalobacter sp.]|jgi:antitoxin CptB